MTIVDNITSYETKEGGRYDLQEVFLRDAHENQ